MKRIRLTIDMEDVEQKARVSTIIAIFSTLAGVENYVDYIELDSDTIMIDINKDEELAFVERLGKSLKIYKGVVLRVDVVF